MNITFSTSNASFELTKIGSVLFLTYALIGTYAISNTVINASKKAIVAHKIRKINKAKSTK